MSMSPVDSPIRGENSHSYPALDYPVGIGTGLVACKSGVIRDMPGVLTRQLYGSMKNGDAWPTLAANPGGRHSGNVINIDHGNGEWTSYLHDSPFDVNTLRGKSVKQGEVFAKSGNNGWSTGPHLHFEVVKNGVKIDPQPWLDNIKKEEEDMPNEGDAINFIRAEKMDPNYNPTRAEIETARKVSGVDWAYRIGYPNDGDASNYAKKYGGEPKEAKKFSNKTWAYRGLEADDQLNVNINGTEYVPKG